MKTVLSKILVKLFNRLFSAKIDAETFGLLRGTPARPCDLNVVLAFFRDQRMSQATSPAELQALLDFHKDCRDSDYNVYRDDLKSFYENAKTLMYYKSSPADLHALLNFYRNYRATEGNVARIDLSSVLGNAETLMRYTVSAADLYDLLNLYTAYKRKPSLLEEMKELTEGQQVFYSQEGEDLILSRIFKNKKEGFYVDIGAHHPKRFSNTYLFYKLGWRGINAEPNYESKKSFDEMRQRDINLEVAVSNDEAEKVFYVFEETALNTFSKQLADEYQKLGQKLVEERRIKTRKLSSILEEHLSGDDQIDFMSIDVENFELPVLESNDWKRFRPKLLLVEILNFDVNRQENFPVHNYITDRGYKVWAKTLNTVFYRDQDSES